MKDVTYSNETYYVGRNGVGRQTGLAFTPNGNCLQIEPINSKGNIAHCIINIPYDELGPVVANLLLAKKEHMGQSKIFEATLKGFNGANDDTDHLVKWISAPSLEKAQKAVIIEKWDLDRPLEEITDPLRIVAEDIDLFVE
jgi:hypothetical protein